MASIGTVRLNYEATGITQARKGVIAFDKSLRDTNKTIERFERTQRLSLKTSMGISRETVRLSRSYRRLNTESKVTVRNQERLLKSQGQLGKTSRGLSMGFEQTGKSAKMAEVGTGRFAKVAAGAQKVIQGVRVAVDFLVSAFNKVQQVINFGKAVLETARRIGVFGGTIVKINARLDRFREKFGALLDRLSRGRRITGQVELELDTLRRQFEKGELSAEEYSQAIDRVNRAHANSDGSTEKLRTNLERYNNEAARGVGEADKLNASISRLGKSLESVNNLFTATAGFTAATAIFRRLARGVGAIVSEISELEVVSNKLGATFGANLMEAEMAIAGLTMQFGLSNATVSSFFASFGDQLAGLGANSDDLTGILTETSEIAQALALSTGRSFEDVSDRISKALLGTSTESAQALGLILNVEEVKAYAESLGIAFDELNRAERAQLTLNLAYEQSGVALASLSLNQQTLAGSIQVARESFRSIIAAIGEELLPVFKAFTSAANGVLTFFKEAPVFLKILIPALIGVGLAVGGVVIAMKAAAAAALALNVATGGLLIAIGAAATGIALLFQHFHNRNIRSGERMSETLRDIGIEADKLGKIGAEGLGDFSKQLSELTKQFDDGKIKVDAYTNSLVALARQQGFTASELEKIRQSGDVADAFGLNEEEAKLLIANFDNVIDKARELEQLELQSEANSPEAIEERRRQEMNYREIV